MTVNISSFTNAALGANLETHSVRFDEKGNYSVIAHGGAGIGVFAAPENNTVGLNVSDPGLKI